MLRGHGKVLPHSLVIQERFSEEKTLEVERPSEEKSREGRERDCSGILGHQVRRVCPQETGLALACGVAGAICPLWIWTRCDLRPQTCAPITRHIGKPESEVCLQRFSAN